MDPDAAGPLVASELSTYSRQGREDGSHLRLGLTTKGMLKFLKEIGILRWVGEGEEVYHTFGRKVGTGWRYTEEVYNTYKRDQELSDRFDELAVSGACEKERCRTTGYDLLAMLKKWLKDEKFEDMSVCEIIITQERFKHLSKEVGIANVFWSHVQIEPFIGWHNNMNNGEIVMSTLWNMTMKADNCDTNKILAPVDARFHWLDYFCLRQCCNDFNVNRVIGLIGDIGTLVATVGAPYYRYPFDYLGRSFCVVELFAACRGKCKLIVMNCKVSCKVDYGDTALRPNLERLLADHPVDAKSATTWSAEEKAKIDEWIQAMPGGFDLLNKTVAEAMLESCPRERVRKTCVTSCAKGINKAKACVVM